VISAAKPGNNWLKLVFCFTLLAYSLNEHYHEIKQKLIKAYAEVFRNWGSSVIRPKVISYGREIGI
jgi:hypothetical protein